MKTCEASWYQCALAIGISTAFSGELVHIDGWFLHAPRDEFKTLTEGRQAYLVASKDRNGKTKQIFSASARPKLQAHFMTKIGQHNVQAAIAKLTSELKALRRTRIRSNAEKA